MGMSRIKAGKTELRTENSNILSAAFWAAAHKF